VTRRTRSGALAQPPTLVPHAAQKWAPGDSSVPHSLQCCTAGAIAWPQLMQNRAPAGFGASQDAQTVPAAGWAVGAACAGGASGGGP
jgi:hypothetical protein